MPQTLVIAEKPAMGRDIAQALSRSTGQSIQPAGLGQRVGEVIIVGALGHLLELAEPEHYNQEFGFPWRLEVLPCLPERLEWAPRSSKAKGKGSGAPDSGVMDRLKYIADALKKAELVVHAGDPDREGQLIVDNILRRFSWSGPTKRLWLHAQTDQGIRDAWSKMQSNESYRLLGLAALCRAEADWGVGINGTRAYSTLWWKRGHKGILNVGRVMTPVIGMIVQRENEIRNFVPVDHFGIVATINVRDKGSFQATWQRPPDSEGRPEFDASGSLLLSREYAESVRKFCTSKTTTLEVTRQRKADSPPLLFSLTELQKAAARLGYSPDAVLQAAQSLYETHKLTSYPRTDCQYAPTDQWPKAARTIEAICSNLGTDQPFKFNTPLDPKQKSAAWNDAKLKEHFAIIPLPSLKPIRDLPKRDADIYVLIVRQYIAQFAPNHEYWSTSIVAPIGEHIFKATGKTVIQEGWRSLFGNSDEDKEAKLPPVETGETGLVDPVEVKMKKTEPPKRFTPVSLLDAMEKAWQFVTDPNIKKHLKQVEGLGTSATRAPLIAKIIQNEFVIESKSGKMTSYVPTPKAEVYIKCVPPKLAVPDLTSYFEGLLDSVKEGTLSYRDFRSRLQLLVNKTVLEAARDGSALASMPSPEQMPEQALLSRRPTRTRTRARSKRP